MTPNTPLPDEVMRRIDVMLKVQELGDRIYEVEPHLSLVLTVLAEALSSRDEHAFGHALMESNPEITDQDQPPETPMQDWLMRVGAFASEHNLTETNEAVMEISIALAKGKIKQQADVARRFLQQLRVARLADKHLEFRVKRESSGA